MKKNKKFEKMERRKKKSSNLFPGVLVGLGVAGLAYGGFKLAEQLFKDSGPAPQRARQRQARPQPSRIQTDFSDVQNGNVDNESVIECDEDIFLCPISKEFMNDPYIVTTCGHSFEKRNIYQWLQHKNVCPLCNRRAGVEDLIPNFNLKSVLDNKKRELRAKNM